MSNAQLVIVRNPFDRRQRDERSLPLPRDASIAEIIANNLPLSAELSAAIDGELITRDEWASRTLKPGQQLVVMPMVRGGDNFLGSILMIAVAVFAPYAAAAINASLGLGLAAGSLGMSLLTAGVGMLGSMIVGGLMGPQKPNLPSRGLQSYDSSPAYSWNPATTQQPGGVVNRAYGLHKLYGNIISGYIENQGSTGQEQLAHLLIDLGSGPYQRLYDFKLNDQPVGYYSGVTITERRGHLNQDTIPAFNDTRLNRQVGAKVVKDSPVLRDTVGSDYDALEIVLLCPSGLWYANDSGGMSEVSAVIQVEISGDGGATWHFVSNETGTATTVEPGHWSLGRWSEGDWFEASQGSSVAGDHTEGELQTPATWPRKRWHWLDVPTNVATTVSDSITLSGSSQQPIRRTLRVDQLVRGTRYKVRVTNLSTDQTSSRYGDDVYLSEINEVMYDDFQYPRTVLVGVDALATNQLSGSIKFSCMAEAAIVRVWNGATWSSAFSRNPAWICWDILTQPVLDNNLTVIRYDGLAPSRLDLASFYTWAQFCDALVPDGKGGTEPRCLFDAVFDTPTSMWEAALEVCVSARAQLVMRGTTVSVVVDNTRMPAQLFTVGNSAVSNFTETFLPMQDRAASIEVSYTNSENDYAREALTVVNTAITESAAQRTQSGIRGVTRSSQAWREAYFLLKRNELLRRSAGLGVDIDALACTVGDLILVQSDVTRWGIGGRAGAGSTTTRLELDQPITLEAGLNYELRLRLADDTLVARTISTAAGTVTAVDVSEAFPSAPALYDVWAIGETGKAVKEFIVIDLVRDGDQRAKLSLLEYNASLYGLDSGIPALPTPNVSYAAVPKLSGITVEEMMERAEDGTILVHFDIHFTLQDAAKANFYLNGTLIGSNETGIFRVANVTSGATYIVQCAPVSGVGVSPASQWQTLTYTVVGKLAPPANVASFSAVADRTGVELSWSEIADVDRMDYAIMVGGAWGPGYSFHTGTRVRLSTHAAGSYTYRIKARDTTGHLSVSETTATVVISAPTTPVIQAAIIDGAVVLTWADSTATHQVADYEVRWGASFGVSAFVGRSAALEQRIAADWVGARRLWVRATDIAGNAGAAGYLDVSISIPSAPGSLTAQLAGLDCQLLWAAPTGQLPIIEYELRYGATWGAATYAGRISSTGLRVAADWVGARKWWVSAIDSAGNVGTPAQVDVIVAEPTAPMLSGAFAGDSLNLSWGRPSSDLPVDLYELRVGSSWAGGVSLGTFRVTAHTIRADWIGIRTYWVAAIDGAGNVGAPDSLEVSVAAAPAPAVTAQVIDNNVLLYWTAVQGTLPTVAYELRRGPNWATAQVIGTKSGSFTSVLETKSGVYTYQLAAIDSAGNVGARGTVSVTVSQPPDYVLKADYNSPLAGTKVNLALHGDAEGSIIGPVNTTETFAGHFTSRGWTTPQQQINAGYPVYAQPNLSPAYYEEVIDYGTVLASNRITVTPTTLDVVGAVVKSCDISVSADNLTWTNYIGLWQVYATNFRYVKVRVTFTAVNTTDLIELKGLNIRLDSKLKTITKMVNCVAADAGGTTVYLTDDWTSTGNKLFIDVDAIALTPQGSTPVTPMYDFVDAPNPLNLKVLLFNNAGVRVSGTCSMTVRGF